jgi:hypothetical protein
VGRRANIKKNRSADRRAELKRSDQRVILNLKLDYVVRAAMREDSKGPDGRVVQESYWKHDRQISEFLIRSSLIAKYPEGSEKSAKKKNAKALNALARATNAGKDSLDVDRSVVEHVQDALAAWGKCPVEFQPWLVDLEDEVERAIKAADEGEKASKNGAEKASEKALTA